MTEQYSLPPVDPISPRPDSSRVSDARTGRKWKRISVVIVVLAIVAGAAWAGTTLFNNDGDDEPSQTGTTGQTAGSEGGEDQAAGNDTTEGVDETADDPAPAPPASQSSTAGSDRLPQTGSDY